MIMTMHVIISLCYHEFLLLSVTTVIIIIISSSSSSSNSSSIQPLNFLIRNLLIRKPGVVA